MKRIEDITKSDIDAAKDGELFSYMNRCNQTWEKWFHKSSQPTCSEADWLRKYGLIVDALSDRDISYESADIDIALFAQRLEDQQVEKVDDQEPATISIPFVGLKKDDPNPERIVYGIVYEPNTKDTQEDWMTEDEIRKAAYSFMENGETNKVNHAGSAVDAVILETFIAPVDFRINNELVLKGSWVMAERVLDDDTWEKIEKGVITGFSMAGEGLRIHDKEPDDDSGE